MSVFMQVVGHLCTLDDSGVIHAISALDARRAVNDDADTLPASLCGAQANGLYSVAAVIGDGVAEHAVMPFPPYAAVPPGFRRCSVCWEHVGKPRPHPAWRDVIA